MYRRSSHQTEEKGALGDDHAVDDVDDDVDDGYKAEVDYELPRSATVALVMYDRATNWLQCYPKGSKNKIEVTDAYNNWTKPGEKVKSYYCDNGGELIGATKDLSWRCGTSTPGMPQTNGLAERNVGKVKEVCCAALYQAGLIRSWWTYAVQFYCFAHNIAETDGNSAYSRRHKSGRFAGLRIPFGALVDFMPQPDHKVGAFANKTIQGIFLGYHLLPGGVWSGDYLVADFFRSLLIPTRHLIK